MHEVWLCQSIIGIIKQQTIEQKAGRIKKIILEIGLLSSVDKNALSFSFKIVSQGTEAEDAELQIIDVPGEAECNVCHKRVPVTDYYDECQSCGAHSLRVIQGEELRVRAMVVE